MASESDLLDDASLLDGGDEGGAPDRFDDIVSALEGAVMGEGAPGAGAPLQEELEAWCRARCAAFGERAGGGGEGSGGAGSGGDGSGGDGSGGAGGGSGASGGASAEHPLAWMALFSEYSTLVESRLMGALGALDPPAEMDEVEALFSARADELAGDVFDVLFSLGDYGEFVSLMRSYAQQVAWEARARGGAGGSSGGDDGGGRDLPAYVGLAPTVAPLSPAGRGKRDE
jgi:hypothetical protein